MNTIIKMVFGSHLYGTATPTSDRDYKGVFMPSIDDLLLQKVPKTWSHHTKTTKEEGVRNGPDDVDTEMYSLHYFLHLACEGETVALDMLHAPDSMWVTGHDTDPIWVRLVSQRQKFYTKNLKSFVGYARRQAAKYGVKGSRLSEARIVLMFLQKLHHECRLKGTHYPRLIDVWDQLPKGEHISIIQTDQDRLYNVCGKSLSSKAYINHYIPMLKTFVDEYGARAQEAAENKGIDWKAVSHAFRAAYQVRHILRDGGYSYPLPETETILAVKQGALDWHTVVQPKLEALMDEVELLSKDSTLPEKVDRAYWDNWLLDVMRTEIRR